MKTIYQITLCTVLLHWANPSEAQLLNRLKNKANAQINKAVLGDNSTPTTHTTTNGGGSGYSSGSSANESTSDRLSNVEKEELYKLEEDERIDYRESKIMVSSTNKISGLVIVNRNGKRFVVENGVKKGPFAPNNVPLNFLYEPDERSKKEAYSTDANEMLNVYQNYVKSDDNYDYIVFNGKKSIGFSTLEAMKVNPEKTKYVALVAIEIDDNNKQKFLINQDGKKVEVAAKGQVIGQIVVNPTFTDAAFWGQDLTNIDYTHPGEMKVILASLSGIKQAIPQLNSVWFDDNGHLLASNGKALYLNGKLLKEGDDSSFDSGWRDVWLNKEGSSWAALIDNKLVFSDGSVVNDGFSVSATAQNGKTVLRWIAVSKGSLSITRYAKTL
ncbi:hypothetical protein NF867_04265 [Solitalea sp. MAHUQ-68]|uniref:Uncharacterized protein n=1 Tax=Solitalea agri TaxID=2953739 RepID=A0A9X2JCR9_9SPHI|nr:hypothetical protein [Solitalea agri]MCO4292075.1 hypothetical protein [Solitalea agri]